jgi:4-amino-4-deoxy-L-arabinose transferase-like glycosyltransferase
VFRLLLSTMSTYTLKFNSALLHAIVLILVSLPYCINLGKSSIWDANEAFYAETPREMLVTGDYLAPHFNFQPRAQKPPLTYWVILLFYKIFGIGEFAVRLPSALAAIGTMLFSYGIARLLFSPRAALFSAVITGTTARIFILARRLPIDILLLFFLTGTLFFLICAIQKGEGRRWALAYVFAALGFLTKGPVALFVPFGTYVLWALCSRPRKAPEVSAFQARVLQPLLAARPLMGVAILVCAILPWYLLIYRLHGWTYISPFFLRDNFGRFAAESLGPSRGRMYYFSVFATDFFPWSFLLIPAAFYLWIHRKERFLENISFGLPVTWCLFIFALFSLSRNKQEYYIAPMYPVAAALLSGILDRCIPKGGRRVTWIPPAGHSLWMGMCGFLAVLLLLLSSVIPFILSSFMPGISPVLHYGPSLVLAAGVLLLAWSIARKAYVQCFSALAIPLWTIYLTCALMYLPALESFRPVKSFCRLIEAQSNGDDEAGYYGTALPSMAFYLRRPIFEENSPEQMAQRFQSEKRIFCILSQRDFGYFADSKDLKLHILDRHARFAVRLNTVLNAGYFPGEELFLVSNRPYTKTGSGRSGPKL